jgi:hypothetical protein
MSEGSKINPMFPDSVTVNVYHIELVSVPLLQAPVGSKTFPKVEVALASV